MKINAQKTHTMVLKSKSIQADFTPIIIDGTEISEVQCTKLVGLTIQNDLKWNSHIEKITAKARSKLFFLKQLKRSGVPSEDLLTFYKSVIIPSLEYGAPAFHTSLTKCLSEDIESIQKRALKIVHPLKLYHEALRRGTCDT